MKPRTKKEVIEDLQTKGGFLSESLATERDMQLVIVALAEAMVILLKENVNGSTSMG